MGGGGLFIVSYRGISVLIDRCLMVDTGVCRS